MESLSRQCDFQLIFQKGRWVGKKDSLIKIKMISRDSFRVAVVTSKKIGKAVFRNYIRRQLKSILFDLYKKTSLCGWFVFILNREFAELEFQKKHEIIRSQLRPFYSFQA